MPERRLEMPAVPMTGITAASAPATPDGRRGEDRTVTLYRTGLLSTAHVNGLCRVRNISNAGLLVVTSMDLAPRQKVQISLSETILLWGHVAWTDGTRVGIELALRIDAAALLHRLAAEHRLGVYRARRLEVNATGTMTTAHGIQPVRINNISQQGMQVTQDGCLATGQMVSITLPNGLERHGIVRWTGDGVAGLRLTESIPVERLGLGSEVSRGVRRGVDADGPGGRTDGPCEPAVDAVWRHMSGTARPAGATASVHDARGAPPAMAPGGG